MARLPADMFAATMNYHKTLLVAVALAGLLSPLTDAAGQSAEDSVGVLRALTQKWQEQAFGKSLGLLTAFLPKEGSKHELIAPGEARRQKAEIASVAGSGYQLIDPVAPEATDATRREWLNAVRHLWKHYSFGPITISGNTATVEVYEAQPFTSKAEPNVNRLGQLYVRYYLTRGASGWRITSSEPVHTEDFILPSG
jgi:hypothetical protein